MRMYELFDKRILNVAGWSHSGTDEFYLVI